MTKCDRILVASEFEVIELIDALERFRDKLLVEPGLKQVPRRATHVTVEDKEGRRLGFEATSFQIEGIEYKVWYPAPAEAPETSGV